MSDTMIQVEGLRKMQDIAEKEGRSVLFVLHNMATITRLCNHANLLRGGSIVKRESSQEVVHTYQKGGLSSSAKRRWPHPSERLGTEAARLLGARFCTWNGNTHEIMDIRKPIGMELKYEIPRGRQTYVPNHHVFNDEGVILFATGDIHAHREAKSAGTNTHVVWIPGNYLAEETLVVGVALTTMRPQRLHYYVRDAITCQVVDTMEGDPVRGDYQGPYPGVVKPLLEWETERNENRKETRIT